MLREFAPALALLTLLSAGCSGPREGPLADEPEAAAIAAAPTHTMVAGAMLTVSAHVSRDMMPGDLPSGLIVTATLRSVGGPIPAGVAIDRVYVVRGDEVWSTPFSDPARPITPYALERTARDGPMWGQQQRDERVNVIVRIRDGDDPPAYIYTLGERIELPQ